MDKKNNQTNEEKKQLLWFYTLGSTSDSPEVERRCSTCRCYFRITNVAEHYAHYLEEQKELWARRATALNLSSIKCSCGESISMNINFAKRDVWVDEHFYHTRHNQIIDWYVSLESVSLVLNGLQSKICDGCGKSVSYFNSDDIKEHFDHRKVISGKAQDRDEKMRWLSTLQMDEYQNTLCDGCGDGIQLTLSTAIDAWTDEHYPHRKETVNWFETLQPTNKAICFQGDLFKEVICDGCEKAFAIFDIEEHFEHRKELTEWFESLPMTDEHFWQTRQCLCGSISPKWMHEEEKDEQDNWIKEHFGHQRTLLEIADDNEHRKGEQNE